MTGRLFDMPPATRRRRDRFRPAPRVRVVPLPPQLTVPAREAARPTLEVVAVHRFAGRRYRCRRCGWEGWSAFGRARRHRRYCRRRDWPWGRP